MPNENKQEIKLFYCYAREDKALRDELEKHLSALKRQYRLTHLSDREILPGEDWEHIINRHLSTSDIILLLISPDFMASDYCYGKEMQRALERHSEGTCCVIPILLRPVYLADAPFKSIQMLPDDAKAITSWADRDEAFENVAMGVGRAIRGTLASHETVENIMISPTPHTFSASPQNSNMSTALEKYINDDPGYLKWVKNNSIGYIINASKPEPSSYLKLHRATCAQVSTVTRTNYTTTDYFKVCSLSKNELVDWARNQRGKLEACKICKP